ncbi:hypothetical protein RB594_006287 [Gaeumannomyces avenae]
MSDAGSEKAASPPPARDNDEETNSPVAAAAAADNDNDSDVLSDIDEDVFEEEYNPDTARVEERDYEDIAKSLKASKRKRPAGETARKPKEGRRDKKRRTADQDDDQDGGDGSDGEFSGEGRRNKGRAARTAGESVRRTKPKEKSAEPEIDEASLTPEERRKRALMRAMDAATKNPTKRRRKKDEVDLEEQADEEIAELKISMENACVSDNKAREEGKPAVGKLKLLPRVLSMMNRTSIQHAILDPETNFLQSVRFFLEPLNDGSLPAYNIQHDIFSALTRLPIGKEALLSSGIGKVVLFYTKSTRPQPAVKRMAEKLVGEWSRPILKRTDDFRKRFIQTREFDYAAAKNAQELAAYSNSQSSQLPTPSQRGGVSSFEREIQKKLAPENRSSRAQPPGLPQTYTIAPQSNFDVAARAQDYRPIGAGGMEAFRKMTQKGKGGRRG